MQGPTGEQTPKQFHPPAGERLGKTLPRSCILSSFRQIIFAGFLCWNILVYKELSDLSRAWYLLVFRFSNLKTCWGKAPMIVHVLSFCFSSHLAKCSSFWILKFWYQRIIHWLNLNLQGVFVFQSSSFTSSPDLAESFCNCSMNSCAGGLEMQFLSTQNLVFLRPKTKHRSQPSTSQAQRGAEWEPHEKLEFAVSLHCFQCCTFHSRWTSLWKHQ